MPTLRPIIINHHSSTPYWGSQIVPWLEGWTYHTMSPNEERDIQLFSFNLGKFDEMIDIFQCLVCAARNAIFLFTPCAFAEATLIPSKCFNSPFRKEREDMIVSFDVFYEAMDKEEISERCSCRLSTSENAHKQKAGLNNTWRGGMSTIQVFVKSWAPSRGTKDVSTDMFVGVEEDSD